MPLSIDQPGTRCLARRRELSSKMDQRLACSWAGDADDGDPGGRRAARQGEDRVQLRSPAKSVQVSDLPSEELDADDDDDAALVERVAPSTIDWNIFSPIWPIGASCCA